MMRQLSADFCAVCQRAIRSTLAPFAISSLDDERALIKSFEELLHSYEELLASQPCPDVDLLRSFEGLLHSFERLLHNRQGKQGFLEKDLLQSFECLLYSFESLLDRLVGLQPRPLPPGCGGHDEPRLPDLVPVAPFPPPPSDSPGKLPQNFCVDSGSLRARVIRVIVRNQGAAPAGPSVTRVEFLGGGSGGPVVAVLTQPTPNLRPGDEIPLDFEIPQGCYLGESACNFRITVDAMSDVAEANEGNNIVTGFCPRVLL